MNNLTRLCNDCKAGDRIINRLEEFRKNAISECLRANNDTLKEEANVKTYEELTDLLIDVPVHNDWDDIHWHSGYVAGLEEAIRIFKGLDKPF